MFLEHSRNFTWLLALLVLQVSLDGAFAIDSQLGCGDQLSCKSSAHWILGVLPSGIKLLFIALGNFWVWKEWREDLLEGRRQFRVFFLFLLNSVAVFLVLAEGYALHFNLRYFPLISEIDVVILTCLFLYLAFRLVVLDRTQVTDRAIEPKETSFNLSSEQSRNASESDPQLIKLLQLMEEQKLYRETGLSLARLKDSMGMPEYRLRQLINRNLGYRNFSTFLNHYRLQEACEALRSSDLPVLTIALSVGFGSITTFNDAFKREFQITPSEYRETV
jgi:AraC-like DNA-binding protein